MTDLELEQLVAERGGGVAERTVVLLRSLRNLCEKTGVDFEALLEQSKERG